MMDTSGVTIDDRVAGGENTDKWNLSYCPATLSRYQQLRLGSSIKLMQRPSGYGLYEYPRLIAYTGFIGIWWSPLFGVYRVSQGDLSALPSHTVFRALRSRVARKIKHRLVYLNGDWVD
jgi:hypothetical protein